MHTHTHTYYYLVVNFISYKSKVSDIFDIFENIAIFSNLVLYVF